MATNPGRSALEIPVAPRIPSSAPEYDRRFMDEYSRVLGLYFRQLDATNSALLGRQGGKYMNTPYGSFIHTSTQAIAAANTPQVVTIGTTDSAGGMSLASNKITVDQPGIYNVHFCFQFENTTAQIVDTFVWLRKNGVDVANSASTWSVTSTHASINGYMLGTANYFVSMNASDYLELVTAADATGVNIEAYAASTSPFTRPSIPGVVVTVSFVSTQAT
jgi:hypothetical protein